MSFSVVEKKEEQFHDQWAASTDVKAVAVDALFESGSCPENQQILKWMGDLKGKRVLEVGCGLGEASVYFAKQGAIVTASDISSGMLDVTQKLAQLHGVKLQTVQVSAQNLKALPDQSYDYIYAANLLHHVNIEQFVSELKTKLKPGGSCLFWDPIHYNPVIQVYRGMATQVRTEDEHPLKVKDLRFIKSQFGEVESRFFWYSALAIFLKFFLIDRIHPNQSRYWKKIIDDAPKIGGILSVLHAVDRFFFSWIPGVRWMGWNIVIRAKGAK